MTRAGIFIGVDQTGNLQKLHDAAAGATRMHEWALGQGMADKERAILITDAGGQKVRADDIYEAVTSLLDGAGVDQLIVYFAGHGVTINRRERWLLTDAPRNASAAVNVTGSAEAARLCGARHVVFISDACRVAPDGIQAQNVQGIEIFPNESTSDRSRPVDQFFACVVGSTAAEIKDPAVAASGFSALYTDALLDGLKGLHAEILDGPSEENDTALYVKPPKLEQYLEREVPARVMKRGLAAKVNQNPDAILTVHPYWLSRIDKLPSSQRRIRVTRSARVTAPPVETARTLTDDMVQSVIAGRTSLRQELERMTAAGVPSVAPVVQTAQEVAAPFGPDHMETKCGIKVRGARVTGAWCTRAKCWIGDLRDLVWVDDALPEPAATVLVTFEDQTGALVPAIKDFIAALTFEDGELVDVSYEISQNTWRWEIPEYRQRAAEVRDLRAVAAAASRHGRFRLDDDTAMKIAKRMQISKGVDPTLAVYAAYAYHDVQANERITDMSRYLREDLGITLFDVALLARNLVDRKISAADRVVPFLPLLGQGWALLGAHRVRLPDQVQGIQTTVRDSLWSLYDERGCELLKQVIDAREVL